MHKLIEVLFVREAVHLKSRLLPVLLSNAGLTLTATVFASVGWWWTIPAITPLLALGWYFACMSCFYKGRIEGRDGRDIELY